MRRRSTRSMSGSEAATCRSDPTCPPSLAPMWLARSKRWAREYWTSRPATKSMAAPAHPTDCRSPINSNSTPTFWFSSRAEPGNQHRRIFDAVARTASSLKRDRRFADSPLEGDGFELSVPRQKDSVFEAPSQNYQAVLLCRREVSRASDPSWAGELGGRAKEPVSVKGELRGIERGPQKVVSLWVRIHGAALLKPESSPDAEGARPQRSAQDASLWSSKPLFRSHRNG